MIPIDRLWRFIFAILVAAALSLIFDASAKPLITPLRTSVTFSAQSPESRWSVPIKSTDGRTVYVLSLEPDFDVGHHVVTLELVLRRPNDKSDATNLLDPTGRRHGLQAYDFAANDLAHGVQKSAYGDRRTVSVKNLGILLRITISKAIISTISPGSSKIDEMELQVEVDNSNT